MVMPEIVTVLTLTLISNVGGSDLNLPEINIGPYNPWRWDSKLLTSLEHHQPLMKPHPGSNTHFPQARYETNITVDPHRVKVLLLLILCFHSPYVQSRPIVSVVTSDLRTGHELSRTHWSGPGTLTLASLAARAHQNVVKYNNLIKRKAGPAHYNTEEVEVFEVPPEHQESLQPHPAPPAVIGAVCRSQYDCSAARRAVCAVDTNCRVRRHLEEIH